MQRLVVKAAEDADALGGDSPILRHPNLHAAKNRTDIQYDAVECDGGASQIEADSAEDRNNLAAAKVLVVNHTIRSAEDRDYIENGFVGSGGRLRNVAFSIDRSGQQAESEGNNDERPDIVEAEKQNIQVVEKQQGANQSHSPAPDHARDSPAGENSRGSVSDQKYRPEFPELPEIDDTHVVEQEAEAHQDYDGSEDDSGGRRMLPLPTFPAAAHFFLEPVHLALDAIMHVALDVLSQPLSVIVCHDMRVAAKRAGYDGASVNGGAGSANGGQGNVLSSLGGQPFDFPAASRVQSVD